ncbi:snake venom 5'-nucleotidase isoform X1 [Uranotaenia lowii]|uniref:snake venom 5'-nucleotidase isoform X1 n=2 Tax=Uranotaenia lowii TaxID=190385 RepID=UPI002478F680|nr:snake venom 5'-nucleotidase isoform X1 [Uranotaenia lowii]XP_055601485.1 snake venom 5'-nucleotidase isoform X1 [Uranotaenia lowii]XP_055601486.1 snake venom 5'-nucleotidase isoform X1 [Uranotaenia lowii]XP_055601487.1 snake venom 5'-nucleotidase isoform X1 [Uranotaenia lowii]
MAGFASQAALRSKWGDLVDSGSASIESSEVSQGLKNVVGWIKQASVEVREAGKRAVTQLQTTTPKNLLHLAPGTLIKQHVNDRGVAEDGMSGTNSSAGAAGPALTILHYNDVYNIDATCKQEPIGGAARFCTAIRSFSHLNPLVLFSGDAFSPSMLSTFTRGEQMVPVLNSVGTHCAVFGNHDFDHGLDVLAEWVEKTTFPWLMSNVVDNETGRPLGGGKITHILHHSDVKIGLIGLVEKEWLDTLPTIDPNEVTYIDFIKAGNQLADELHNQGCDVIIALTHMRTPNDIELAKHSGHIDLILGGHDHVFEILNIEDTHVIKSGTDFRQFSRIGVNTERNEHGKISITVEKIDVNSTKYNEDPVLKEELKKYSETIESKMDEVLGTFSVELDGRFSSIRTSETNLGNWICDVALAATGADAVMINSGTFRSDQIHQAGPFTMRDLVNIIPMQDPLIVLEVTGKTLHEALENSVCTYPKLEGRFPQIAGMSFAFDPSQPPGKRVEAKLVRIGDEWLNLEQNYTLCIKSYIYGGCDGYTMFKGCRVLMDDDAAPELGLAIQNHFKAIDVRLGKTHHTKHRQSLVTLSRRHSMIQMLENLELDGPTPIRRKSCINQPRYASMEHVKRGTLMRRASLDDLEQNSCQLAPSIQHRIIIVQNQDHMHEMILRRETMEKNSVIKETDELTP